MVDLAKLLNDIDDDIELTEILGESPEFNLRCKVAIRELAAERDALKADVHGWEVYVGKLLGSLPLGDIIPASSSLKDFSDRLSKMVTENYSLRNEVAALKADLDAARKQEPFAYCFTDVNGKPTQFTDAPKYSHPNDLRVIKPLYASPVPAQQVESPWQVITNENWNIPKLGQRVILFSNGAIQNDSYTLDRGDDGYFWSRDDVDECPEVMAGDAWMPWPSEFRGVK